MTKKHSIVRSAIELFAKQGIEATSIQQITTHCGISKGAFYLSFKSKEELILAIIDYFMHNIVMEVDQAVKNESNSSKLFYIYFKKTLESITAHQGIAHIFMNEPLNKMGEEILKKVQLYDELNDEIIRYILLECYGEEVKPLLYDLPFIVKGLFHSYSFILLTNHEALNFDLLSESLAEKVDIIARHSKKPYMTQPLCEVEASPFTQEAMLEEIEQLLEVEQDALLIETLMILKEEVMSEAPRRAVLLGMLANCESFTRFNLLIYMVKHFMK